MRGRALTLGKQDVLFDYAELIRVMREVGLEPALGSNEELNVKGHISDSCLFKTLGFTDCQSLDYSDYEKADHAVDLNKDDPSPELDGQFDLVYDGGTLEHVFHVPNALHRIFRMLRVGGRVLHTSPCANYLDHGFYMFSPTFFVDFYSANCFDINAVQMMRLARNSEAVPWEISNYTPGCLDDMGVGGLDDGIYMVACTATKTDRSTGTMVPQQRHYLEVWNDQHQQQSSRERGGGLVHGTRQVLGKIPILYSFARWCSRTVKAPFGTRARSSTRKKGLGLDVVARY